MLWTQSYLSDTPNLNGWQTRHMQAVRCTPQHPIIVTVDAWCEYASAHARRFESPIGEDYVLGPAWARWGFAIRELLNGETGNLDCGTLDTILCRNLEEQGFDPDQGTP